MNEKCPACHSRKGRVHVYMHPYTGKHSVTPTGSTPHGVTVSNGELCYRCLDCGRTMSWLSWGTFNGHTYTYGQKKEGG